MWFVSRNGVLSGVVIMLLLVTESVRGGEEDAGGTNRIEVPTFSVEVVVSPASGPMYIPPANPPSKPYTALIRISDSEVGNSWVFARGAFYAGDTVEKDGTYGPYTISCSVTIDENGEKADVVLEYVRWEGDSPLTRAVQRFTAHLPRSPMR